jgi:histidinol-phosphate aminotransferase
MSRYWSKLTRALTPYVPGEQPGLARVTKLNTNESPYPPSPQVLAALAEVEPSALRLYPDPQSTELRNALAASNDLALDQVFVGNGSDEVIAFAFMAFFKQALPICFPDVTYSFYPVWADLYEVSYRQIPVDDALGIDVRSYPSDNGGVIMPNPNAPTGLLLGLDAIEELLQRSRDSVVVIDEAYIDFGGKSAVSLINSYDNLLVVRTFSKSRALAGLRVGAAFGSADLIEGLDRIKNSFNSYPLDCVAQRCAVASLEDDAYFVEMRDRIIASRLWLATKMEALGFAVLPSAANFVFARHATVPAAEIHANLRNEGILTRHFAKDRIDNYLRISIGTQQECEILIEALSEILAQ